MTNRFGPISRRVFLHSGASFALLATAPTAWARSSASATRKSLTRSHFTPLLGAKLRMTGGGVAVVVVLTKIGDLTPVLREDDPNRFVLLFEAPLNHERTEGIRRLYHDALRPVSLFVSPVDRGVRPQHYAAVINRSCS